MNGPTEAAEPSDGCIGPSGSVQPCGSRALAVRAQINAFSFGSRKILGDLQLSVKEGEAVSVLGPSGCGKSTLIRILAGLVPRRESQHLKGRVALFGTKPQNYRSTGKLAVMFQDPTLLPHLTVEQNIRLPLEILGRPLAKETAMLVNLVGLQEFRDYLPRDLSGGMRTRAALARSFVSGPSLLLMDEPFSGLDLGWRESLYDSLQKLRLRFGTTVVLVTHNLEEAVFNSERILVMNADGEFIEELKASQPPPKEYRFGETISHHSELLGELALLLGNRPVEELARYAE